MNPLLRPLLAVATLCSALSSTALRAQIAPPPQQFLAFPYDSGTLRNPSAKERVVASHTVRVQSASWIRLRFQLVQLWNDGDPESGAYLRITSHTDGATQELHALHAAQWQQTSAYFNGDAVQIDVVAPAGAGASRVILRSVWVGPPTAVLFSQCGPTDDRMPSSDPRATRVLPIGCTGWMFDDCNHCFGTAGHCSGYSSLDVAEFNVPFSNSSGSLQHPSPDDQYAIDDTSQQWYAGGIGNDWGYFGCFPNSNTGLTPFQAQGACFQLAAPPALDPNHTIRITGYGTDSTPDSTYNQVQQTHSGPFFDYFGTTLRYAVDTTGGNSGSPILWDNGGGVVIGVHTHAGCSTGTPTNGNHGTASVAALWVGARNNPQGVCVPSPATSTYCTAKVNSLGCTPTIGAVGSPSASGGAGSFTIVAGNLVNQKSGVFFYGYMPSSAPFQGGFKCVAAPTVRTPLQSSGGSVAGSNCSGTLSFDMGARIASGIDAGLVCGAIVYGQFWSRDPADPFTTNLTAGLRFRLGM